MPQLGQTEPAKAPRVSVLLTCYNHRDYLEEAVAGVRAQTFHDYELIALDDGSTDGSREWLSAQPDIRCIFNEVNIGTYGTLNVGLRAARGEFIAVLNDDDVWRPEKLARQIELMDAHPEVGLCHTGGWFLNGVGNSIQGNPLGFSWPTFPVDDHGWWIGDALQAMVFENKIIASAALARTAVFDELGGFKDSYFGSGDWEMWFRTAERYSIGFVASELTGYRVHGTNASHKLDRIWQDDQQLRRWMAMELELDVARERVNNHARAFNFAALGTVTMLNGDAWESRRAFAKSIRLDPGRWKSYARYAATFLPRSTFRRTI